MHEGALVGQGKLLGTAAPHVRNGGSVLLSGPAGIGKSTLVRALAEEATRAGDVVLRCGPAESEQRLPFLALVDLLTPVGDDVVDTLPGPQRDILRATLLRGACPSGETDQLAVRLATLYVLRNLGRSRPILLVLDDIQWIDPDSASIFAFVSRRGQTLNLRVVATERTPSEAAVGHQLCPPPLLELTVPPLLPPDLGELLRARFGTRLPRHVVDGIHSISAGNPFFATEIARALLRLHELPGPGEPLPVPDRLRTLMLERLGALSATARSTLLLAATMARPTRALLTAAHCDDLDRNVAEAAEADIAAFGREGILRFSHPLLAATLQDDASPAELQAAHLRLAQVAPDPVERARHLALAAPERDEYVAETLMAAAASAHGRGAPGVAAELALLAAARTPADKTAVADERRLQAAAAAIAAGRRAWAEEAARSVLAGSGEAAQRVRAYLCVWDASGQEAPRVGSLLQQALDEARDDPALQAPVLVRRATMMIVEGFPDRCVKEADLAAELALAVGDATTAVQALSTRGYAELLMGRAEAIDTQQRAARLSAEGAEAGWLHDGPEHLRTLLHLVQGRVDQACVEIAGLLRLAERRGSVEDQLALLTLHVEAEIRAGRCRGALGAARRGLRLMEDVGLERPTVLYANALAEAVGGCTQRAHQLAAHGARLSQAYGDRPFELRNLAARGLAALASGDPHGAREPLRRARALEERMGVTNPAAFGWHGDLAEALMGAGRATEAQELVRTTRARSEQLDLTGLMDGLDRAAAMCHAGPSGAGPYQLDRAAGELAELASRQADGPLPVEHGRTLLALGVVERRRRRRAAARAALQEAVGVFDRAGALVWRGHATAELDRAGAPLLSPGEAATPVLNDTELSVARLVGAGATNREAAERLYLSVKTIEANLTSIYRKLGVRSRAELARSLPHTD